MGAVKLIRLFLVLLLGLAARVNGAEFKTAANVMVEITFEATGEHKDPFNELTLDAIAQGRPYDIRFQGKTGSRRPTTKMTRLTQADIAPEVPARREASRRTT